MVIGTIFFAGQYIPMMDMPAGHCGTLTDYTNPGTEIIVIIAHSQKAEVKISKAGFTIDHTPTIREVQSFDLVLEKEFTGEYRKKYRTKYGPAVLILKHKNENIN